MSEIQSNPVPIAIIGIGCRFAGDATDPSKLWAMLESGNSAWSEIPANRFNIDGWYHPNHENISTTNVRGGHFLKEDLGFFDAQFFGVSAETAAQHIFSGIRSLTEDFSTAGLPLEQVAGSTTSVFSGAFFHDYQDGHMRDAENLPRFLMTGNGAAMASNRISHFFDLRGPSMTIDTGCSTTLTALHQACQGLRSGDADMSIVGGSNLLMNPDFFVTISTLGYVFQNALKGRQVVSTAVYFTCCLFLTLALCRYSFDNRANGYGRGEGVAAIILKRLDDAVMAGDPVQSLIRETHLNQDGKTETITSPSCQAQEYLIRSCYDKAGINPSSVQYFEAHGTGTPTGDPIEASAIASVFQKSKSRQEPLYIGSVKANLGHTEPTSGLASVIKVSLALQRRIIPPSINFETPNERLALDEWNLRVPLKCEVWPTNCDGTRRASVNNFGYGGANAHVIMEDWHENNPLYISTRLEKQNLNGTHVPALESKLFILSAKDENCCRVVASNLKAHIQDRISQIGTEFELFNNLAFTLGGRRSRFPWVSTHVASSFLELVVQLGNDKLNLSRSSDRPRLGFIFTGQGAQWYAMGRELLTAYPLFKASILEAEAYLKEFGCKWSLTEELLRDEETSMVTETSFGMPLCAAIQISLVRLLEAWGITPAAVSSHSSGEIAAAYTVGALSYRSAMAACFSRCEIASGLQESHGAMMAVGLGAPEVGELLRDIHTGIAKIACINSPSSVTLSGDVEAIDELEAILKGRNVFARRLRVRTAFHSHHMQPLYDPYLKSMHEIMDHEVRTLRPIIYASPTTGTRITDAAQLSDPKHWAESMVRPVLFQDSFRQMVFDPISGERAIDIAIEVGPHAALSGPVGDILLTPEFQDTNIVYLSCLIRKRNAVSTMQTLASELLLRAYPVDVNAVNFPTGKEDLRVLTDLPPYPWNHQVRHWDEPRANVSHRSKQYGYHDLLGSPLTGVNPLAPIWRHIIRLSDVPWVREHTVQSNVIYPGAGYVCMAIEAASQISNAAHQPVSGYRLRDLDILQALIVPEGSGGVEVQLRLTPVNEKAIGVKGWKEFRIFSVGKEEKWTENCKGLIHVDIETAGDSSLCHGRTAPTHLSLHSKTYPQLVEPQSIYAALRSNAIYHGGIFQNIQSLQAGQDRAVAKLSIADVASTMPSQYQKRHVLHPITLDSVFVSAYGALLGANLSNSVSMVPKTIKSLWVSHEIASTPGHMFESYVDVVHSDAKRFGSSISLYDQSNSDPTKAPVLVMDGFVCQSLGSVSSGASDSEDTDICSTVKWAPDVSFMEPRLLNEQISSAASAEEEEVILNLRLACFHFIQDALASLSSTNIQNLEWHHKKFYNWMKDQVGRASRGEIAPSSSEWIKDSDDEKRKLISTVSSSSVNGEAVCRLGTRLIPILTQQISPLELLMEDKLLYRYYRDALKFDRCNIHLAKLAEHLVHKSPRMKIIEIGAGTGGTTLSLLNVIGNGEKSDWGPFASEYHFTDISSGFFEEAQLQFQDWNGIISYRKLDIEVDPAQQGFDCRSYDIVVANQVLHATNSVVSTMKNVRSLLKPGGKLLLMENTKDQMDMQFVFGLLPGWWLSSDERKLSPILSSPDWDKVLTETGFSGRDLDIHDCDREDMYTMSVIMSTALTTSMDSPSASSIVLVHGSNLSACDEGWIRSLQQSVASIKTVGAVNIESLTSVDDSDKVCVFLGDLGDFCLSNLTDTDFKAIVRLALGCKSLLWVTRGGTVECQKPESALSLGLLRTLRRENLAKIYVSLDMDAKYPAPSARQASIITTVLAKMLDGEPKSARDFELSERDGTIFVPRLVKDFDRNRFISINSTTLATKMHSGQFDHLSSSSDTTIKLQIASPGLLETLAFQQVAQNDTEIPPDEIEIEPKAFGLNFRDVMAAMGQLNQTVMGLECSGIVTRMGTNAASHGFSVGCRVITLIGGQYQNRIRVPWTVACPISQFDFNTAASIPMVFATAYISLFITAKLCKGQSILIHAASGGVGQAAIILSRHIGAEIFATVGSAGKRNFITSEYGIPDDHVFSSREPRFASDLMSLTGGNGVDVILNCLSSELLQQSFNCLAPFGHFVEIGKVDLEHNHYLEMAPFTRVATFSSIDLLALVRLGSPVIHHALCAIVRLLEQGFIYPVKPITTYPISDIGKAFRQMQTGKHMGKIVLSAIDCIVKYRPLKPTMKLRSDASYLIPGGIGGIGKEVAAWLLAHGARCLVLMSRTITAEATLFAKELEDKHLGSKVHLVGCDISRPSDFALAAEKIIANYPPVRGVIQAAMVLRDSIIENMRLEDYNAALLPKVQGSWNLHQYLGKDLDFFIMLSSLAGVIGNPSQSNYTAGGAFQDSLARYRVGKGLPGVSLDIGAVKNVGYVASNKSVSDRLERQGYRMLETREILSAIESAILYPCHQIAIGINTEVTPEPHDTILGGDARFDALRYIKPANTSSNAKGSGPVSEALSHQLSSVSSVEEASAVVLQVLVKRLVDIFMIPIDEVIHSKSMADFGVDSLIAVELRNMLAVQAGAEISIFDIMQSPSLTALAQTVASTSKFVNAK
ncbi:unnamed protein product [Penicillium olsonii]|nr:unnamed protein product [Penicillium olsonii]